MFLIWSFVRSEKYYTQYKKYIHRKILFDEGERVTSHEDVLSTRHAILPNVTSQKNVCVGD